jgi:LysR family transcriptional regulator for bpeEF and oprC
MDRFKAMEVFVRVVEAKGLSKAAQTLSMTRSSVTMTIQKLERHLGVRLLSRSTRAFSLTTDGSVYYDRCVAILAEVAASEASLKHELERPRGRLRVDMSAAVANSVIIPALDSFRERYPEIDIAIGLNDRRVDLIQEGIDCAIRTGHLGDSRLISKRIGSFNWITCASRDYLQSRGRPQTPTDMEAHDKIGYFYSGAGPGETWSFGRGADKIELEIYSAVAVNETSAYLALALKDYGLIRLADFIVRPLLETGHLEEVLEQFRPETVPISIIYPTTRHLSPVVRVFVDWASAQFRDAR